LEIAARGGIVRSDQPERGGCSSAFIPATIKDMVVAHQAYRVIVADDEACIRELMQTLLSLEPDFEVVGQAGDGVEAVELVSVLHPDLVVIDISMPVMDGPQAIERIRQVSPTTLVAVLSGEPRTSRTVSSGADTHIEKGTPNEVVVATLRTLCQNAGPGAIG
jgi:DNA-binding NarL/FixJ family response regulator